MNTEISHQIEALRVAEAGFCELAALVRSAKLLLADEEQIGAAIRLLDVAERLADDRADSAWDAHWPDAEDEPSEEEFAA